MKTEARYHTYRCWLSVQGQNISTRTWSAVLVGLLGSCLIAYDSIASSSGNAEAFSSDELRGMSFLLSACLFYSLAIVRLGVYAPRFSSVDLAAVKKLILFLASFVWFFSIEQQQHAGITQSFCAKPCPLRSMSP